MMSTRLLCHGVLIAGCWPVVAAESWQVSGATRRYALAVSGSAGGVGGVGVWPQSDNERVVVAVDAGGRVVGSRVVWSAPGEPMEVLCAGTARWLYVGASLPASPAWEPDAGLVMETRKRVDAPVDSAEQLWALWDKATPVQRCSVVGQVFHGINPHGPSFEFCARYQGVLSVARAGRYALAIVSDDGSALRIDGKPVVAWPGWHGPQAGQRGEFHGMVELTAGRHRLDYVVVQGGGGFCAEVAWKPPGSDRFAVIPAEAFGPVATFAISRPETPQGPDPMALTWDMTAHVSSGTPGIDPTVVAVTARLVAAPKDAAITWRWDDGAGGTAAEDRRLLPAGGRRTATVTVAGVGVRSVAMTVKPRWTQAADLPAEVWQGLRGALLQRDPAEVPARDLDLILRLASELDDQELGLHTVHALLAKASALRGAEAAPLLRAGLWLQDSAVRRYPLAVRALRACAAQAEPAVAGLAGLHLGGLLEHGMNDPAGAGAAFAAIDPATLAEGDRRLLRIYQADLRLLTGEIEAARAAYTAISTVVARGDLGYATRRRARLELARDHLSQGEVDAAEKTLRAIEWETPLERIGSETGLLLTQVWLKRGELAFAASRCRMLLAAGEGSRTPEVLLMALRLSLAAKDSAEAARLAARLKTDHPYSEAAARVDGLLADGAKQP
jgi:hypothetical protein